jgi:AraC family transcriptional regulator
MFPDLQPWRLKRSCAYIDAHLSERLSLADVSRAAGFTGMHFARLFRASTGLSPHNYVLRRRIAAAKVLLLDADHPMLDIALLVGFRTHAHFSSVFKRLVGEPPSRWKQTRLADRSQNAAEAVLHRAALGGAGS